jgi:multiple sugar transport system substrate-binding protein
MGAALRGVVSKYIEEFSQQYPNITIEGLSTSLGDYDGVKTQISNELVAQNSPHLAFCYPDHVAHYMLSGKVVKLDDYIMDATMGYTNEQLFDFVPAFYNEGKVFGSDNVYTLPFAKSTEVMYYNETYFNANNLKVPTTWDEMETVCQQILDIEKAKGRTDVIPLGYDSEANWFITMCEQLGQPYTRATGNGMGAFLFNTPENRGFVERFTSWHKKGYVTTKALNGNSYTSDLFTNQTAYMCIGSSAGASYQKAEQEEGDGSSYAFNVGVAQPPQANKANPKVISQGPSLVLFKKPEQEQAAAWLLMKFLTSKVELQAEYSMTSGYMPVIKSAQNHEVYQDFLSKANGSTYLQALCVKQSIAQMDSYYVSAAFDGSSAARDQVGLLMQACFVNAPSTADGIKTYVENKFDEIIDDLEFDYA